MPDGTEPVGDVQTAVCLGHAGFTEAASVHAFVAQRERIVLRHHPDVFPPSAFGLRFADHIDFRQCRRAIDVGTGTGLLAILAARKGVPEVKATDVSLRAIRLAQENARELNGIDGIEMRQGHFFGGFGGAFDVITANLPQEILPPAYRAGLNTLQSQAIDGGGSAGNAILLDFLDAAPRQMHAGSRLYVIVNTITDYQATLARIERDYCATLVWAGVAPTKRFVADNIDFYRELIAKGTVSLAADESGRWLAQQYIYRLALKP